MSLLRLLCSEVWSVSISPVLMFSPVSGIKTQLIKVNTNAKIFLTNPIQNKSMAANQQTVHNPTIPPLSHLSSYWIIIIMISFWLGSSKWHDEKQDSCNESTEHWHKLFNSNFFCHVFSCLRVIQINNYIVCCSVKHLLVTLCLK